MFQNFDLELTDSILRLDFKSFVQKCFYEVSGASEYKDNWHINVICDRILDMFDNKNNRLIVNVPPRYLKSVISSIALPAYLLGLDPRINIICVSYNDELSYKLAADSKKIIMSPWYQRIFSNTKISNDRRSISDFETTEGGCRFATSINGTITGRGADWIIIDDPIKASDKDSDILRNKVNNWYKTTLYTRLNDKSKGKILLIMQRLHENDLTGYLLNSNNNFTLLKLPIIAEKDEEWVVQNRNTNKTQVFFRKKEELLHPERDSDEVVNDIRDTLGEFDFASQYQQNPSPQDGGLIKRDWFQYYDFSEKAISFNRIVASWDTASKVGENNAFSACVVIGVTNEKYYILDCYRGRLLFPDLEKKVLEINNKLKSKYNCPIDTIIEDASSGTQLIQMLEKQQGINIKKIAVEKDKISRFSGITSLIEKGTCLFPGHPLSWWEAFENELLTFPKSKFKDQCDALSQGLLYAFKVPKEKENLIVVGLNTKTGEANINGTIYNVSRWPVKYHPMRDPRKRRITICR